MSPRIQILLSAATALFFFLFVSCTSSKISNTQDAQSHNPWAKAPVKPERLLLITIDQFQEDYIALYDLKNFAAFKNYALRFSNAYVGHLPTIGVLSHAVLTTGLFPKNLPFQDRIMQDTKGDLGKRGMLYSLDHLKRKQFEKLLKNTAETNLHTRLKYGHRGDTFTIGNLNSNAYALGSPYSDLLITLDAPKKSPPLKGWCFPIGVDVPQYFLFPSGGRFFLDCNSNATTNGTQYIPGNDLNHLGGDTWVADSVLEIMKQESDWRAIFADFASYDSISHKSNYENASLQIKLLKNLDEQFGKIIHFLEDKNLLKETMIVITSTHGGQKIKNFHGLEIQDANFGQKVYGALENYKSTLAPKELIPILKTNLVKAISFDTSLKLFLNTRDTVQVSKLASAVSELPGVAEVYTRQENQFIRIFRHKNVTGPLLDWAKEKHQELIGTMTSQSAPDLVAFLFNDFGYSTFYDSGCPHKDSCQKIPVLIWAPNIEAKESAYPIRIVDLNPVISRTMKISLPSQLDGSKAAVDALIIEP